MFFPRLSGGSPAIAMQLLPHQVFWGHLNRDKLENAAAEENTAVSWWVFAEKSSHASFLGKGSPVVAEKLTNPYK